MPHDVGEGEGPIGRGLGAMAEGIDGVGELVTVDAVSLDPLRRWMTPSSDDTSATSAARTRWASRFVPWTERLTWRARPLAASCGRWAISSHTPGRRSRMEPPHAGNR